MQLCRSPPHGHVGNFADQTATNLSLAPAMVTKIIKRDHAAFQRGVLVDEALTDHRDTILVQHAKRVKIWAREGRLGQVEVFLQMCCLSTSIFERPRHFYAINTPKSKTRSTPLFTKSPYTVPRSLLTERRSDEACNVSRDLGSCISGHSRRWIPPHRSRDPGRCHHGCRTLWQAQRGTKPPILLLSSGQ